MTLRSGIGWRPSDGPAPWFRAAFVALVVLLAIDGSALAQSTGVGASGLKLPRYVSLKSDNVNVRKGPGLEYPTDWVFRQAGLPVEILREFEGWRQIRDADGSTGWVAGTMLSGRRTALIAPWSVKPGQPPPQIPLSESENASSAAVAALEAGVIVNLHGCDADWCEVTAGDYRGFIPKKQLWGVYADERLR